MKNRTLQSSKLFGLLILLTIITSCNLEIIKPSGPIITKDYDLKDFDGISISTGANVSIRKGADFKIEIKTNENLFNYLNVEVQQNTLKIYEQEGINIAYKNRPEISITLPALVTVKQCGSGEITVIDSFTADAMNISLTGSGNINCATIACKNFKSEIAGSGGIDIEQLISNSANFSISGSGTIKTSGKTDSQKIDIAGSGDILSENLEAKSATISIAGSGNCHVKATDDLKVSIAGSGDVYYSGNPKINIKTAGSGQLHNKN